MLHMGEDDKEDVPEMQTDYARRSTIPESIFCNNPKVYKII